MKTKIIISALLLIISLFANSFLNRAFSQTAVLNNDCETATLDYPLAPLPGNWTCDDPGVTFANENNPSTIAFNIPFDVPVTFTWSNGGAFVTIDGFENPNAYAGLDISLCDDAINFTNLDATIPLAGTTGEWFRDQGTGVWVDNTDPKTLITGLNRGESIHRWVVTNTTTGCTSEDQVSIFFMPVTADAGPNDIEPICDDTYELSGNDPDGQFIEPDIFATGFWQQIPPTAHEIIDNTASYNTTVSNLDPDDNRFRWRVTNGYCSDFDDVIVRNNLPAIPDAKNDTVICSTSYFLEAEPPTRGVGVWEIIPVSGGGTIVTPSLHNSEVTNLDHYIQPGVVDYWNTYETINTFRWTVTFTDIGGNECTLSDDVDVINLLPLPADAGEDQTVCATTANLNAECLGSGAMEHLWYQDGGDPDGPFVPGGSSVEFFHPNRDPQEVDNTEFNTHVEGLQTGITSFIWFKRNQLDYHGDYYNNDYSVTCVDTDTMQIESIVGAIDINAGQNGTICADTITLQATPNSDATLDGHWEVIAGTGVFTNSTDAETFVSGLALTTNVLRWTIYDNSQGCIYTDDVYYTNALPSGKDVGADVVTCDDYARITANRPIRGTGEWSYSGWPSGYDPFDPGSISSTSCQSDECNTYIYNLIPGTYDMTWTVTNEYIGPETPPGTCQIDTTMHVYMMGVTAEAGVGQAVCDDSTQLNAVLPDGMTGEWESMDATVSFSSGAIVTTTNHPSPSVYNLKRGSNFFRWTIDNGVCNDTEQIVVYNDLPSDAIINDPAGTGRITECSGTIDISSQPIDADDIGLWEEISLYGVSLSSTSASNTTVEGIPEQEEAQIQWTVTHTGVHPDIGILSNECSLTDEIYLLNNSITAYAMDNEPYICAAPGGTAETNITATLTEPLASGLWSKNGGDASIIVDDNSTTTLVTNITSGTHYYTWTVSINQNGVLCQDDDVAIVHVEVPHPATAFVLDENNDPFETLEVCVDEVTLQADPPPSPESGVGEWSKVVMGGTDVITSATDFETTVTGLLNSLNERRYRWTITTEHNCQSSDEVVVLSHGVEANAHVGTGQDVPVCEDTYSLTGNDLNWYNSEPLYIVQATGAWTGPGGGIIIANSASNTTDVSGLPPGGAQNTFTWTITKGNCIATDFVNIYNNEFTISAGGPYESCDETITMNAENPGIGYGVWERAGASGDIVSPSDFNTEIINITTPGDNYFKWTVYRNGCEAEDIATVTNNTVVADAGTYLPLCEDSVRLSAGIMPDGASGIWALESGSAGIEIENSLERITWARNLAFGSSTFRWTISKGSCDDFDIVEINNMEVIALADNIEACEMPVRLSGNNPADFSGTGLWEDFSGTITFVDDPTIYNARIDDVPHGSIIVLQWTVTNGQCSDATDVFVENNSFEISAGINDEVCGDEADLSAEDRGTGYWEVRGGTGIFDDSTAPVTTISGLQKGDNLLRWTVSDNGCMAYDEIIIRNNSLTVSAGPDDITCDNSYYLIGTPLSPTATGNWSGGGSVVIEDPGASSTLVENLSHGINTFTWSITDNECISSDNVIITSNYFTANAGSDQSPANDFTTMNAGLPDVTATGVWITYSGSGTPTSSTSASTVMNNLGYGLNEFIWHVTWNGCNAEDTVSIIYNPLEAGAGVGGPICSDDIFLNGNDPSIYGGTGKWTVIEGYGEFIEDTNPLTEVIKIERGKNVYRWTVTINGASTSDDVTYYNNRFTLFAGFDQDVCEDNTQLHGDEATNGFGTWSIGDIGNGIFNTPSSNDAFVSDLLEGPNDFIWTVDKTSVGGCIESDTVSINFNTPPTAAFITDISEGCSPIDIIFTNTSSGGETYYWDFGEEERTDTELEIFTRTYNAVYENDSVFTTKLIVYSPAGCTDTVIKEVTVFKIPKVEFEAYPTMPLYPDATIYIENRSGETYDKYYWDYGDGTNQIDHEFVSADEHTYPIWGEYLITLTAEAGQCEGKYSQLIKILAPQPKDMGGDHLGGCEIFTAKLRANVEFADTFHWDLGDHDATSSLENPTYPYDAPGRYYADLYAGGPGTDGELIFIRRDTVDVYPTPVADFVVVPDTVLLPNQAVHCDNFTTNGDYFEWDFGDDTPISTDANPLHFYTEPGTYNISLKVYTKNECFDAKTVEDAVVVLDAGFVKFPTAFSPNPAGPSDGKWYKKDRTNDIFHAVHRGVKEFKLEIFNRWGEKVFESSNPAIGWDGYIDGKLASQDVYVWKVNAKYTNGVLFNNAGDVTLIR